MFNLLTCPAWKLATVGIGVVSLGLSSALLFSYFENRSLSSQREELAKQINDPRTGFVVRLAQANTNVETLKVALDTQRKSFQVKEAERNAALVESTRKLNAAQVQTRAMQLKLDRFLSTKPQGSTLDARVRDIDARALAEFVE